MCETDPTFEIDVLGYSNDAVQNAVTSSPSDGRGQDPSPVALPLNGQHMSSQLDENMQPRRPSHVGIFSPGSGGGELTPGMMEQSMHMAHQTGFMASDGSQPDRLSAISHTLMNEEFMAMDRIITLDDMIFAAPTGTPLTWMPDGSGHMG